MTAATATCAGCCRAFCRRDAVAGMVGEERRLLEEKGEIIGLAGGMQPKVLLLYEMPGSTIGPGMHLAQAIPKYRMYCMQGVACDVCSTR